MPQIKNQTQRAEILWLYPWENLSRSSKKLSSEQMISKSARIEKWIEKSLFGLTYIKGLEWTKTDTLNFQSQVQPQNSRSICGCTIKFGISPSLGQCAKHNECTSLCVITLLNDTDESNIICGWSNFINMIAPIRSLASLGSIKDNNQSGSPVTKLKSFTLVTLCRCCADL